MPLGYQKYAVMSESSTFSPAEENPQWYKTYIFLTLNIINIPYFRTLFKQEGIIEMVGFGRMSWLIEVFAAKFLTRGARNNVALMEEIIKERLSAYRSTT